MKAHDILVALSVKYEGDFDAMHAAMVRKEDLSDEEIKRLTSSLRCKTTTIVDDDYPQSLRSVPKTPIVLYYYGDISLVSDVDRCVSYIGSRDASPYGLETTEYFVREIIDRGYVIVSGLARGIDAAAAETALKNHGKTVAVLGSGIDVPYPSTSRDLYNRIKVNGLILSEYPPGTEPRPHRFPARNRIIAGLSSLTIVGEAGKMSGTLITVGFAMYAGRDVACIPYPCRSGSACNSLIRDGALLLDDIEDLDAYLKGEKTLTENSEEDL